MNEDENSLVGGRTNSTTQPSPSAQDTTAGEQQSPQPTAESAAAPPPPAQRRHVDHDGRENDLLLKNQLAQRRTAYHQWHSFATASASKRCEKLKQVESLVLTNEAKVRRTYWQHWLEENSRRRSKNDHDDNSSSVDPSQPLAEVAPPPLTETASGAVPPTQQQHVDCQTDFDDAFETQLRDTLRRRQEAVCDSSVQTTDGDPSSLLLLDASAIAVQDQRSGPDALHLLLVKRKQRLAKGRDELAATLRSTMSRADLDSTAAASTTNKPKKKKKVHRLPKLTAEEKRVLERQAAADNMACRYRVALPPLQQQQKPQLRHQTTTTTHRVLDPLLPRSLTAPPTLDEDVSWQAESPTRQETTPLPLSQSPAQEHDAAKKLAKDIYFRPHKANQLGLQDLFSLEKKLLSSKHNNKGARV